MPEQTNPLLQFDSPRRAYNSDEYTTTANGVQLTGQGTQLSSNLLLGPGLTVTLVPSSPAPGAKQYAIITADTSALEASLSAALDRITALEAKRFSVTALKSVNYTAASWDHVLVDLDAAAGDVTITLPSSPAVNDRVKITDMSATAGQGTALRMNVAGTFAPGSAGNWATSPHSVAYSADVGVTLKGASAELVYTSTGWIIVSETCSVANIIFYTI